MLFPDFRWADSARRSGARRRFPPIGVSLRHPTHIGGSTPAAGREGNDPANVATHRFLTAIQLDFALVLAGVFWLQLVRWLLIVSTYRNLAPDSTIGDLISVSLAGLRFDIRVAILAALPSILLSLGQLRWAFPKLARRVRWTLGVGFFLGTLVLGRVAAAYLREFHSLFDDFVLGAVFDDRRATIDTLLRIYEPAHELAVGIGLAVFGSGLTVWFTSRSFVSTSSAARVVSTRPRRIALGMLIGVVIVGGARGSLGRRPVQEKDAAVTSDRVLAELVLNPYESLRYAIKRYRRLAGAQGLETYLPDGDIARALREYSGRPVGEVDEALIRVARGRGNAEKPRHVFLVVMESYDAWTLLDEYAWLGLSEGIRSLGAEGLLLRNFLPASTGTMTSLASIITGMADAGVITNHQLSARSPYPSSLPEIFRRLGYRTQLFYGGYLSWQGIGAFASAQGFDHVYGGADMGGWLETNEWGVDDEDLFDFVSHTMSDDFPSFNLILSVSNHPPYDLDVYEKGFPLRTLPATHRAEFDGGNADLVQLGHRWYSDREVARWLSDTARQFPSALFAVTGDHWSRRFIGPRPNLFVRSTVPLLLYGPPFRDASLSEDVVGTHLDIGPTLIERVANPGFAYHAMGNDLLGPDRPTLAIGRHAMIGSGVILDPSRPETLEPLPQTSERPATIDGKEWRRRQSVFHAIAWWRMVRGNEIPQSQPVVAATRVAQ